MNNREKAGSNERFPSALTVYEAVYDAQKTMSNQEVARERAVEQAKIIDPDFAEHYKDYLLRQRDQMKYLQTGQMLKKEGAEETWYSGARTVRGVWPDYRAKIDGKLPRAAVETIDETTEATLYRMANPKRPGSKRKGLVLGYVQSGKTANFQALIAKSVDAGYRVVIVLAGLYSNLRAQTQARLEQDLELYGIDPDRKTVAWDLKTDDRNDIAANAKATLLGNPNNVVIMVVKKHEKRLKNVEQFLHRIPQHLKGSSPVLVIDDESDQASPNSQAGRDQVSTINRRLRDIWKEVETGTYVAYTATPFANLLINPAEEEDFYPEDFIVSLPKPEGYLGADDFFDTTETAAEDDEAEDEKIFDLSLDIPVDEAEVLVPSGRDIEAYAPEITQSLGEAIRWFILATAIRELRTGRVEHSSMLVHTTHRVKGHELQKEVIDDFLRELALGADQETMRAVHKKQTAHGAGLSHGEPSFSWDEIWNRVGEILPSFTVKIDNGKSSDRLAYPDGEPQRVIAVGGGTLSRGLTLEGLVVSYFLRSSNAYDTLLQMGRWFGFRPHYADLVRVWVGPGLIDDYRHLARVERQIRDEISQMAKEDLTPRRFAPKILIHPGRLEITARGKMADATLVRAGIGGTRRQTIYLDKEHEAALAQLEAASKLVERAASRSGGDPLRGRRGDLLYHGLRNEDIVEFFEDFWTADPWMQPDAMERWLSEYGRYTDWELVLVSGVGKGSHPVEIAGVTIGTTRRARIRDGKWSPEKTTFERPSTADLVNIRALMSSADYTADISILAENGQLSAEDQGAFEALKKDDVEAVKDFRKKVCPDTGVLLLYLIDKSSKAQESSKARTDMDSQDHLVGLGVVFPHAGAEDPYEYASALIVEENAEAGVEDEDELLVDREGDFEEAE